MNKEIKPRVKQIIADYLQNFERLLKALDLNALERIVQRFCLARNSDAMIYVAGNGGSAAIASHWVNDLGKATKRFGQRPMRVISLSDNTQSPRWRTKLPGLMIAASAVAALAIFIGGLFYFRRMENFADVAEGFRNLN